MEVKRWVGWMGGVLARCRAWGEIVGATHLAFAELAAVDAARTAPVTAAERAAALRDSDGAARLAAWRPRASIITPGGVGCGGVLG